MPMSQCAPFSIDPFIDLFYRPFYRPLHRPLNRRSGDADAHSVVAIFDYFYHKEHLFIICELLRDNLYEVQRYLRDAGEPPYFTLPRLQKITKQCLEGLIYTHSLDLIHCDLKPENILIKSFSRCEVKVIDFGSTCFTTDHLTSYVQSRSYRAPEVTDIFAYGNCHCNHNRNGNCKYKCDITIAVITVTVTQTLM